MTNKFQSKIDNLHELNQLAQPVGPYIWQFPGKNPGPNVWVMEAVHGNETDDFAILKQLMERAQTHGVQCGSLNLAVGNPMAYILGKRFKDFDMNRSFGSFPNFEHYESLRVAEIKPYLAQADLLLDMHATIKPSAPFIVVPQMKHKLSKCIPALGIKTVITGPGLFPDSSDPIYSDTFVNVHGGLGITVEAGWKEELQIDVVMAGVMNSLLESGIFEGESKVFEVQTEIWEAYWNVIATKDFAFTEEFENFQKLPPGKTFAVKDEDELKVEEESIVLFPKPSEQIVPGNEACIIARKVC